LVPVIMRRYHVRVEFEGSRLHAVSYGSVDADEFDRLGADNTESPIAVRISHVLERVGDCDEWRDAYAHCFEEGEEVPMYPAELEVIYEFWEPGPGEQRLLDMMQDDV